MRLQQSNTFGPRLRSGCSWIAPVFLLFCRSRRKGSSYANYENSGRLVHVIEGRRAALIAATAVERGMVTQLDRAVYLGRELEGRGGTFDRYRL